jgi:hypothetical protein
VPSLLALQTHYFVFYPCTSAWHFGSFSRWGRCLAGAVPRADAARLLHSGLCCPFKCRELYGVVWGKVPCICGIVRVYGIASIKMECAQSPRAGHRERVSCSRPSYGAGPAEAPCPVALVRLCSGPTKPWVWLGSVPDLVVILPRRGSGARTAPEPLAATYCTSFP